MGAVAVSIGDVEIAETENALAGEDDRRQREFGHRHGIGLGRMADRDTGFEDGVVYDAFDRARRMDDELKMRRGGEDFGPDIGPAPAGDQDFGLGQQTSRTLVVEALQRFGIQQATDATQLKRRTSSGSTCSVRDGCMAKTMA